MSLLESMNDDLVDVIAGFLRGRMVASASVGVRSWARLRDNQRFWYGRCCAEQKLAGWAFEDAACWRSAYARLAGAVRSGRWVAGPFRRHGLEDRVAAPQLFASRYGGTLYNYGGWTRGGPQTDLRWVASATVESAARGAGDAPPLEFAYCRSAGRPAVNGGAQTLTPLWTAGGAGAPSDGHAASCLRRGGGEDVGAALSLVVAYGGGGGGYRHEHNDWAVGVLEEPRAGGALDEPRVRWVRAGGAAGDEFRERWAPRPPADGEPLPRCAHSGTYVPSRCFAAGLFEEGCVVFFGGHSANTAVTLAAAQFLDVKTWTWLAARDDGVAEGDVAPRARHGHSASLYEAPEGAYLIFAGGGEGIILDDPRECVDASDAQALFLGDVSLDAGAVEGLEWLPVVDLRHESYAPGRHHTAAPVGEAQVALYGGGHRPDGALVRLDLGAVVAAGRRPAPPRSVDLVDVDGGRAAPKPTPRKFHAMASLYPKLPLVVVHGGWRYNPHFDDLWIAAVAPDDADLAGFREARRRVRGGPLVAARPGRLPALFFSIFARLRGLRRFPRR